MWSLIIAAILAASPDLTGDGIVNGADLGLLQSQWGKVTDANFAADLNRDGSVNGADLGLLLGAWGELGVTARPVDVVDARHGATVTVPAGATLVVPDDIGEAWLVYKWTDERGSWRVYKETAP